MNKKYIDVQREKAVKLLHDEPNIFSNGESGFIYGGKAKEDILKEGINNVFLDIRQEVVEYFKKNEISFWHIGKESPSEPSGHLLSSQICCINHLFPIRHDKENVLKIAKKVNPDFVNVLPITTDKYMPGYIQFESVSDKDHLNEDGPTRGSHCTSVDALIYAEHKNGDKYIIPIEWKYTELFDNEDKSVGEKGKERLDRYVKRVPNLIPNSKYLKKPEQEYENSIYFRETFYQLMRQTLWAEQMLVHKDSETIKADDYIHVHIIPSENGTFLRNGETEKTWLNTLKHPEKYKIFSQKEFLENIDQNKYSNLLEYLKKRYWDS